MKTEEIELLVKYSKEYVSETYVVMYRIKNTKKIFGLFLTRNPWKHIYHTAKVLDHISCDFPMAYSSYNNALYMANKIKENPDLIEEYEQKRIKLYNTLISERDIKLAEKHKYTII